MPENNNAFCSASESNTQNPQDTTSDLPFFFRYKHIISLKNHLSLAQGKSLLYWFRDNFCGRICFDFPVIEFSLSAVANRFELRCQSRATDAIM